MAVIQPVIALDEAAACPVMHGRRRDANTKITNADDGVGRGGDGGEVEFYEDRGVETPE